MNGLEPMADFFTSRVEGYDRHMLENVEGCREAYALVAQRIPDMARSLLDLGCGTGLELDAIFQRLPDLQVTGIDLTAAMLDKLREKHPDKAMQLICGDYFAVELGEESFDCAVSVETMHHFTHEKKTGLYRRIARSLTDAGLYIECDYMVDTQAEEDFFFAENERLRREAGLDPEAFYHYDTPCTIDNQKRMLLEAGFTAVTMVFRQGGTVILVAQK